MMLSADQIAAIRQDYKAGYGPYQSARRQDVSYQRVRTQYDKFERASVPRRGFKPSHGEHAPPPYVGSPWHGKAITAPPAPIGPDWIGKAA